MVEDRNGEAMLTDAEAELYDRQIRLWGLESQKRLRMAKILLIGLNGFGAEVAKNIILAGIKSVTLLDHRDLTAQDFCSQFLVDRSEIGKNRAKASVARAQKLNPMVHVIADESNINSKPEKYFKDFDVVCATECTITQLKKINAACKKHNVKFFAGDVWGSVGYTFADLNTHEYVMDIVQSKKKSGNNQQKNENIVNTVKKTATFVPFKSVLRAEKLPKDSEIYHVFQIMLNYREKYGNDPLPSERGSSQLLGEAKLIIDKYNLGDSINNLIECDLYSQISPICAIVGGVMAQEIIKAVSRKEPPHNNLFLFNPDTMCGKIIKLGY